MNSVVVQFGVGPDRILGLAGQYVFGDRRILCSDVAEWLLCWCRKAIWVLGERPGVVSSEFVSGGPWHGNVARNTLRSHSASLMEGCEGERAASLWSCVGRVCFHAAYVDVILWSCRCWRAARAVFFLKKFQLKELGDLACCGEFHGASHRWVL